MIRFDLRVSDTHIELLEGSSNPMEDAQETPTSSLIDTRDLHCSGRIVKAPDRFIFLVLKIICSHVQILNHNLK